MKTNLINIIILWWSTFVAGMVNYIYHPIMLYFLTIEQFSEFGSLVALFNILWVLTWAISLFLVKEISKDNEDKKLKSFFYFNFKYLSLIWLWIYIFFLLSIPLFSSFLKIDDYLVFIIIWITIILSFTWLILGAFLQAKKRFKFISFTQILLPILKLILWVWLVLSWFNIYWATWGFILSQFLILLLSFFVVYKYIKNLQQKETISQKEIYNDFKLQKKQILHYFFASILLAIFMNADILFAKHFFDDSIAWIYAWISIIAKFVLFLWMSIETVYFPIIIADKVINKTKIALVWVMYIIMLILGLIFLYLFWEFFLELMKNWFWEYLKLLYLIVIYSVFLALVNFFTKIFIWFKKYIVNYVLLWWLILLIISLYTFVWNSMYSLIIPFNIVIFLLVLFNYIYLWVIKK